MLRFLLLSALTLLCGCGGGGGGGASLPQPPMGMSIEQMTRYVTRCVDATDPNKLPVDPSFVCGHQLNENDSPTYRSHDWPNQGDNPQGYQIRDSYLATRGGKLIVVQNFDYPPWGTYEGDDGADLLEVGPQGAAIFHTRDASPADANGRFFLTPGCSAPGWVLFAPDVDASLKAFSPTPQIVALIGSGAIPPCPGGGSLAPTAYQLGTIAVPFQLSGVRQDFPANVVIETHCNATATACEREWFILDYGAAAWASYCQTPLPAGTDTSRWPGVPGDQPPPGLYQCDGRLWTNIWPEVTPRHLSEFRWPPQDLTAP